MRRVARWIGIPVALAIGACVDPLADLLGPTDCSVAGQCTFVRDTMKDIYLWYQEMPDRNPADFDSPEAYLEAVRYRPLDESFSFISGKAEDEAFYSESQFVGVGLGYTEVNSDQARITQVFPDGPAAEAGIVRGDCLLEVNGQTVAALIRGGGISSAFGANNIGVTVDLVWQNASGERRSATLTKRAVTIPTVSMTQIYDVGGERVGYIFFRNFVKPSIEALNQAFTELKAEGAGDLILDLRYNGGGLTSVARHLGGLIGGHRTKDQVFAEYFHNDKNSYRNSTEKFEDLAQTLNLSRLIVITTDGSASASEAVINGLRPFIPVTIIGTRTYGKPVGQYGFDFCEKVLYPVSFKVRNARGEGDYFNGFPPDCTASDDLDHQLGDSHEVSLAEALYFVRTGQCSPQATAPATRAFARWRAEVRFRVRQPDGWRQMVNAY